jgi:hypothetical protein
MRILPLLLASAVSSAAEAPQAFDVGPDPMRYIESDRIRLGVDLSLGGAVTFLEDKAAKSGNMINSHDFGRQIQQSYYSGPVPFIGPGGEKPVEAWAGLGWNPIQSGSYGQIRSRVLSFDRPSATSMRIRCVPMQWPHINVPGDCVFEATYAVVKDNAVELTARILNARTDKTLYPARTQEMPALYTNGRWYKLVTYRGGAPFTHAPLTTLVDKLDGEGWPWLHFYAAEQWAALVDEEGRGVGLYQSDTARMTGGFFGGDAAKGSGGERDPQTGYISPVADRILDANIDWSYRTYIVVGSVEEIRAFAYGTPRAERPAWNFEKDRCGWTYRGSAADSGWPIRGSLDIVFKKSPPGDMASDTIFWRAEAAPEMEVEAAFEKRAEAMPVTAEFVVHPVDGRDIPGGRNAAPLAFPFLVNADGIMRIYRVRLADRPEYKSAMKRLVFRFPPADGRVRIRRIAFCLPEEPRPAAE